MLIKVSDVRDAIEEVWITFLWTKINKIDTYSEEFCESENMSSFVVSSLKKIKVKKLKVMLWLYIPRHIENWVSLFTLNLKFRTETHVLKYVVNYT